MSLFNSKSISYTSCFVDYRNPTEGEISKRGGMCKLIRSRIFLAHSFISQTIPFLLRWKRLPSVVERVSRNYLGLPLPAHFHQTSSGLQSVSL